jgi:hypothetical protein
VCGCHPALVTAATILIGCFVLFPLFFVIIALFFAVVLVLDVPLSAPSPCRHFVVVLVLIHTPPSVVNT